MTRQRCEKSLTFSQTVAAKPRHLQHQAIPRQAQIGSGLSAGLEKLEQTPGNMLSFAEIQKSNGSAQTEKSKTS